MVRLVVGQIMIWPLGKRGFFMSRLYTFTSESVCAGHPDKICDRVSDAIVDAVLAKDPYGRVAVEALATYNHMTIAGEVTSQHKVNFEQIARQEIKKLGYSDKALNFTYQSPIDIFVHTQSREIAAGVDVLGAGDQGMMFGFACCETETLMPLPISIAHALTRKIDEVREKSILSYLRPDGKAQITVEYKNGKPYKVQTVVIAVPHKESVRLEEVKKDIYKKVITPVLGTFGFKVGMRDTIVNGTGIWHFGGPASDTGVTGRKIIVDTYGGYARVGGGCFSGKDPTKVDRSAAYAARFLAKNIIAHKLADKAEVRIAYFIGAKKPIMQEVETYNTSRKPDRVIKDFINKILDTSVAGILDRLDLRKPIYKETSCYGHFGRNNFSWEKIVDV